MDLELLLNATDAFLILGISIPALVIASRIKVPKLRTPGVILAAFFILHGLYHLLAFSSATFGGDILDFASDGFLEPVSYVVLLIFGIYLYRLGA